jgi:hypothetical protein
MLSSLFLIAISPIASITVDATRTTPISPYIYGVNYLDWGKMGEGFTLVRQGGNRMSAYNWETNASNAGNDYHHQNDGYLGESNEPGWTARTFLEEGQKHGAAILLTVPTTGHVSADKNGDGDVNKTPDYIHVRFHESKARKGQAFAYPPNTSDKVVYQDEFVAWIEKLKKPSTPVWFSLDNEPDLWGSTHERIWPKNPTFAQIIANNQEYAAAIKAVAPKTLVFGPANYGWMGFRRFQGAPDAGDRDFLDVYLASMKEAEKQAGRRLLDVLDVHWYPEAQGDGVRICMTDGKNDKPGTNAARIQAPRSLWDPTYVEDSWITKSYLHGKPIALIPGIQAQIAKQYPGTKFSITEYNYGGGSHISGAIAQADALGIFGRYGVFAACNWGLSAKDTASMAGFRAFSNYNGNGARFGDSGCMVTGEVADSLSLYAATDSKNKKRMTIVAVNKTSHSYPVNLALKGFFARSVGAYVVEGPTFVPKETHSFRLSPTGLNADLRPLSVTTFVLDK